MASQTAYLRMDYDARISRDDLGVLCSRLIMPKSFMPAVKTQDILLKTSNVSYSLTTTPIQILSFVTGDVLRDGYEIESVELRSWVNNAPPKKITLEQKNSGTMRVYLEYPRGEIGGIVSILEGIYNR